MKARSGIAGCSCWLLALCVSACEGSLDGQPAVAPSSQDDCHTLDVGQRGFRQSPRDVLEAFPSQRDVPMFWMNGAIEEPTDRLEQSDVRGETWLTFEIELDESREITECVSRPRVCRSGECELGNPSAGYMTVPVRISLQTDDGATATFAMDLIGDAPADNYPINVPTLQWPSKKGEPYLPVALSSDAAWGEPGFGEFAMSYVGHRFLGRFHHPERGVAVWPTPCGGQVQVAPNELVFGQPDSVASVMDAITSTRLVDSEGGMPDVHVRVTLADPTACYDIRGKYHVDLQVTVETDGATFEATAIALGSNWEGENEPAFWQGACGDVSASAAWSSLFEGDAQRSICVDGYVRRSEEGFVIASEVSTVDSTTEGFRIAWNYDEAP